MRSTNNWKEGSRLDDLTRGLGHLATEGRLDASLGIDELPTLEALRLMNEEDAKVAPAVGQVLPAVALAVERIAERLREGGRLFYVGAGTSGRLGVLDASECPPTFGVAPEMVQGIIAGGSHAVASPNERAEDDPEQGAAEIQARVAPGDAVVGIAASGRTPYTVAAVDEARRMGCFTVGLSCNPGSPLGAAAEVEIAPVVGPEVIMGSTRLKAGTAQKLVLNMISTGVMMRLGKVYSNLMVDMVASNVKLEERARRMVMLAAAVSGEEAARALTEAEGSVKKAVVMLLAGVTASKAEAALTLADGHARRAIALAGKGGSQ